MKRIDIITSLCAIFIAVVALVVAIYEAKVTREYQETSVWPHLTFYSTSVAQIQERKMPIAFYLKNDGIGPALVKKISYKYLEKEINSIHEVFKKVFPDDKSNSLLTDKEVIKVMLPGKEHLLYGNFTSVETAYLFHEKVNLGQEGHFEIEVCYCSLYEKCWILQGLNEIRKVNNCD
jgi:hypothetical protein